MFGMDYLWESSDDNYSLSDRFFFYLVLVSSLKSTVLYCIIAECMIGFHLWFLLLKMHTVKAL